MTTAQNEQPNSPAWPVSNELMQAFFDDCAQWLPQDIVPVPDLVVQRVFHALSAVIGDACTLLGRSHPPTREEVIGANDCECPACMAERALLKARAH